MTASHVPARPRTYRNPLGRFQPRCFSVPARHRFVRDRKALYLARVSGAPTDWQAATIETLIELEWAARRDEAADTHQGRREGREHRRLFLRILGDFERSLVAGAKPAAPTLAEHLARRQAEAGAAR